MSIVPPLPIAACTGSAVPDGPTARRQIQSREPHRVLHIINGLNVGGAERLLQSLVMTSDVDRFRHEIVSLGGLGPVGAELRAAGFPLLALTGNLAWAERIRALPALIRGIRRADVVHTWLYHANVIGGLLSCLFAPVVWSLHATALDPLGTKRMTYAFIGLSRILSRCIPARIIACADSSAAYHLEMGYPAGRIVTIHNGICTDTFRRDETARDELRRAWGLEGKIVVGNLARFHPQKDHETLIRAAAMAVRDSPGLHFILCGDNISESNPVLAEALRRSGVARHFTLLGRRTDVSAILSACDLFALSSAYGEALPLALCEAMSCSLPAVTTDVGDCAEIVGDCGRIVPPREPAAFARALVALSRSTPSQLQLLGERSRERVLTRYSLVSMVAAYEACYSDLITG